VGVFRYESICSCSCSFAFA